MRGTQCSLLELFREIWVVQSDAMYSSIDIQRNMRGAKWYYVLTSWTIQRNMRGTKWSYVLTIQRTKRGTKWCYVLTAIWKRPAHPPAAISRWNFFYQFQFWNSKQSQLMSRFWTSHLKISKKLWSISKENSNIYFLRSIFFLGQTYFSWAIQTSPHLALQITKFLWWGLFSSLSLFVWVSVCTKSFPSLLSQARFLFLF